MQVRKLSVNSVYCLDRDVEQFRKIVPFRHIAIFLDRREIDAFADLDEIAAASAEAALNSLLPGVDAALVGPLWHFNRGQLESLARGLIKKKVPGFSLWDFSQVEMCLLVGLETSEKQEVVARRTAFAVMDVVQGDRSEPLGVEFMRGQKLTINMATARALDIYPSLFLLTAANVINEQRGDIARRLNIKKAIDEAVSANLRLLSAETAVRAGSHAVKEARAGLLPRIDLETGAEAIDEDRAEAGFGSSPERVWTGAAGGSILLYSEQKWASFTAEEHIQEARKMDLEKVRLNVTYDAAVAYLNVLRAGTIEQIYKEKLKLTEANLDRARIRVETGAAGPDEVYRWEVKFANDRQEILYRESDTMDAMEALNRILHRPIQELFMAEEAGLDDPLFIMGDRFFRQLMERPQYLNRFKDFAIREAMDQRPEPKGYEAAIKATERLKTGAKRELWLPDFTVDWRVEQYFAQDGAGQRDSCLARLDDTDWNVGVYARIPLFEGGRTMARMRRLQEEVSRLRLDRSAEAEAIIQNVLSALNRTRASYPSIRLSKEAAKAARRNLDLVTDSYIEGIKSIIDLLDAQNQALSSDLDAANAVYDFLIDFMGVQRAMGRFVTFMPEDNRKEWVDKAYAAINGKQRKQAPK
ncbi:MAG TPA: hypothetical protein EYP57_08470 [Thermodesulfobacteriaceae bacterium]|nr:hypothetical protein [Thermodesulfobacteriaceae bacterium]